MPEEKVSALEIGQSCPTCGRKVLPKMGDGDYSCVGCGMGMKEPCEHWKKMLENPRSDDEDDIDPPAADAGPRQPERTKSDELEESLVEFAGRPSRWCKEFLRVFNRTQSEVYIPAMVALYEKQCREKFDAGAPPVPQEAAPRLCINCKEEFWAHCRFHKPAHCHAECAQGTVPPWPTEQYPPRCNRVEPATAPDEAMRVAREIGEYRAGALSGDVKSIAALIRQAGSERERELTFVLKQIISDLPTKRDWLDPAIEREASRLLGGESK